jgi:hypothetical protein
MLLFAVYRKYIKSQELSTSEKYALANEKNRRCASFAGVKHFMKNLSHLAILLSFILLLTGCEAANLPVNNNFDVLKEGR